MSALIIIILLIVCHIKMRSIRCIQFVHLHTWLTYSKKSLRITNVYLFSLSSTYSSLSSSSSSSSSKLTNDNCEKYRKVDLFE